MSFKWHANNLSGCGVVASSRTRTKTPQDMIKYRIANFSRSDRARGCRMLTSGKSGRFLFGASTAIALSSICFVQLIISIHCDSTIQTSNSIAPSFTQLSITTNSTTTPASSSTSTSTSGSTSITSLVAESKQNDTTTPTTPNTTQQEMASKQTISELPIISNSNSELQKTSTQSMLPTIVDYKQRPMPAGRSTSMADNRVISYDLGPDEVNKTQKGPKQAVDAIDNEHLSLSLSSSVIRDANSESSSLEGGSSSSSSRQIATGELISVPNRGSSAASSSSSQAFDQEMESLLEAGAGQEPVATASSLSRTVVAPPSGEQPALDTDNEAAPIVMRHGRASQEQTSYRPPATSRLQAYVPSFQLQNSRSQSRQQQQQAPEDELVNQQIGASPLQVNNQQPVTSTSTSTTTAKSRPQTPFDPIIVCYLGSWSVYRPSLAKFTPENINPFLCTHIIYAFAGLSSKYELKPFDSYNDITQGGYRKFTSLKEHNKQLKTLIAVGGWNEGSAR